MVRVGTTMVLGMLLLVMMVVADYNCKDEEDARGGARYEAAGG